MRGRRLLVTLLTVSMMIPNTGLTVVRAEEHTEQTIDEGTIVEEVSCYNGEEEGVAAVISEEEENGNLPVSYNAIDEGLVTEPKHQVGQTCGAYSTIACIETAMIKDGMCDNTIDLSEKYLTVANGYTMTGSFYGNEMAAGRGITLESNCPTSDWNGDIESPANLEVSFDEVCHVSKIELVAFPDNGYASEILDDDEIENIKKAILTYGSVKLNYRRNMTLSKMKMMVIRAYGM